MTCVRRYAKSILTYAKSIFLDLMLITTTFAKSLSRIEPIGITSETPAPEWIVKCERFRYNAFILLEGCFSQFEIGPESR
jgi:hypothetical protein